MKLDRNTNRGGRGKYALVNMRKLIPVLDNVAEGSTAPPDTNIADAFNLLIAEGIITLGNETPGDQFFVMKYKDKFTHEALSAYGRAVCMEAAQHAGQESFRGLIEYADQIIQEYHAAKKLGNRIPD